MVVLPGDCPGEIIPPSLTRSKLIVSALNAPPVKLNEPPTPLDNVLAMNVPPLRFKLADAPGLAPIVTAPLPVPKVSSSTFNQPAVMLNVALSPAFVARGMVPACWPTESTVTLPLLITATSNRDGCQLV